MGRLFKLLVVLFAFYIGLQFLIKYFGEGHDTDYRVRWNNLVLEVKEKYNNKSKDLSYYFEFDINNNKYVFQTYQDFNKADVIVKSFRYYEGNTYKCLLPIFSKKELITDFICLKNGQMYLYNNIIGQDQTLDEQIRNIDYTYDINKWKDDKTDTVYEKPITVYTSNILDNHYVYITNYKGIYTINNENFKKLVNVPIFANDVYKRDLGILVDKFYITANYQGSYDFNIFYMVDLTNNKIITIETNKKISFESYFQGVVDNSIYLIDKDSKKQYQINIKDKTVVEIGNKDIGVKYYNNGNWEWLDISSLNNRDLKFNERVIVSSDNIYSKIDRVGDSNTGYSYFYKKSSTGYDLYRAPILNEEAKIYLGNVKSIDSVSYYYDYIYFTEGSEIKFYHDSTGFRTLFKNEELEFNNTLKYGVYIKK